MECFRKTSSNVLPEIEGAENESGKCPKEILVTGFSDWESHCESFKSRSFSNWSVGCPNRLVGPRKPIDIVLSNPTKRCFLSSVCDTMWVCKNK